MTMHRLVFFLSVLATIICANHGRSIPKSSGAVEHSIAKMIGKTDSSTDGGMRVRESISKNHSCLAMELLSCECSPFRANSGLLVNCSSRNLSRVPASIPTNTVSLLLSGNQIKNIPFGVFQNLSRLINLDLSKNEVATYQDGIFTGLTMLERLYLHDNPFKLIPTAFGCNVFSPLNNLRELNLKPKNIDTNDNFHYPDVALGKLKSLHTLIIDGLSNKAFGDGFQNMTSLRTLNLALSPNFDSISQDTFRSFQNIPVKKLLLSHSSLTWIHPEALQYFPNIDTIDYSFNKNLEIKGVAKSLIGLQNTPIRILIMMGVHSPTDFTSVTKDDILHFNNTKVEEVYLDHNSIVWFEDDGLSHLPRSLKIISASYNRVQITLPQLLSMFKLTNLTQFNVNNQVADVGNYINDHETHETPAEFPKTKLTSFTNSYISGLEHISDVFIENKMSFGASIPCPPKLWKIQCSKVYMPRLLIPKLTFTNCCVTHADFSYNLYYRWEGPLGLDTLLHLNLSGNNCDYVSPYFFDSLPNLQTLRIAHNRLGKGLAENTFSNLTSLHILDMHGNLQESTRPALFSSLINLQELDISSNYLSSWEANISNLVNLTKLNLTGNKLNSLPPILRENLDAISGLHSIRVDISGNELLCNCDTKDFVLWFTQTKVSFDNLNSTMCKLQNETKLSLTKSNQIVKYLRNHCRSYAILIGITSVCVGLFILVLVGFIINRNRWKIRYLIYVTLNRKERSGYQRLDEGYLEENQNFFDAFVSYEDGSRSFVIGEVIPRLETGIGLKLCIDKRDFVPGLYVADNIMHAIRNSKTTVAILTKEFLKSKWCMYELNMARMEAIYNDRQTLIVVLLEDIPSQSYPREILDLFRLQTYIELVDDPYASELFWNRLRSAIKRKD